MVSELASWSFDYSTKCRGRYNLNDAGSVPLWNFDEIEFFPRTCHRLIHAYISDGIRRGNITWPLPRALHLQYSNYHNESLDQSYIPLSGDRSRATV